jgi:hypothetical protein
VPKTSEKIAEFAVYRTLCCDAEHVIIDGAAFPDCPNHPNLRTRWKELPVQTAAYVPKQGKLLRFDLRKDSANTKMDDPSAFKFKLLRFDPKKKARSLGGGMESWISELKTLQERLKGIS